MIYRNQTPTMTQITLLSQMRITTTQEAVAYLRASAILDAQVAEVLQKASLRERHLINRAIPQAQPQAPAPTPVVEPEKPFTPEELTSDEGYAESEVEKRVAELKTAQKTAQKKTRTKKATDEQPAEKEGN